MNRACILCCGVLLMVVGCHSTANAQKKNQKPSAKPQPSAQPAQSKPAPPPVVPKPKPSRVETMTPKELETMRAVIETSEGDITLEFFGQIAPEHVRQFLRLADQGFYNGTTFSRVVRNFVIQGGNPGTWEDTNPNRRIYFDYPKLKAEFSVVPHERGTLSMARPGDDENGATCHFFICLSKQSRLDGAYSAFGQVVEGMEVVDKIGAVDVNGETPTKRIEVKRIRVVHPDGQ